MSEEQKKTSPDTLDMIRQEFSQLMEKHGIVSLIADIQFADGNTPLWLPGCKEECTTPNVCHAINFLKGAQILQNHVEDFLHEEVGEWEVKSIGEHAI